MTSYKLQAGFAAIPFKLPLLAGGVGEFNPESSGPKLLFFYKVSCHTCQFGMPYFDRLYRAFRDRNIPVFAVAQEDASDAKAFADEYDIQMPQYLDSAPYSVSRDYGLVNVPTMVSVDGRGIIERVTPAFVKEDVREMASWLAETSGGPVPDIFGETEDVPALKPG